MTLLALVALAWVTGCKSPESPSGGFASVLIRGHTPGQIREATQSVLTAHAYKLGVPAGPGLIAWDPPPKGGKPKSAGPEMDFVYEKEGSRSSNVAYGNWISDQPVWLRLKISIVPISELTFRLQARPYWVRDRGTSLEEEIVISSWRKGNYQKLLDEVAAKLGQPPGPAP